MKQTDVNLNSAREMANNGQDFIEDTSEHTGVYYGFQPHKDGCIVTAVTITDDAGNTIDETNSAVSSWIDTTLDLDSWMSAGLIGSSKGYITSITLSSGAATMYKGTITD